MEGGNCQSCLVSSRPHKNKQKLVSGSASTCDGSKLGIWDSTCYPTAVTVATVEGRTANEMLPSAEPRIFRLLPPSDGFYWRQPSPWRRRQLQKEEFLFEFGCATCVARFTAGRLWGASASSLHLLVLSVCNNIYGTSNKYPLSLFRLKHRRISSVLVRNASVV